VDANWDVKFFRKGEIGLKQGRGHGNTFVLVAYLCQSNNAPTLDPLSEFSWTWALRTEIRGWKYSRAACSLPTVNCFRWAAGHSSDIEIIERSQCCVHQIVAGTRRFQKGGTRRTVKVRGVIG
jgi:hypothetical protein